MVSDFSSIRIFLLEQVLEFVKSARKCPGVSRISLVGSLSTAKPDPKDADVLVIVSDDADLTELAELGRRLKGRAQGQNKGADIFLANPDGKYIGRICHWRECRPFVRKSCGARKCGKRHYLNDDLDVLDLDSEIVAFPAIELWPAVIRRVQIPNDVEEILLGGIIHD